MPPPVDPRFGEIPITDKAGPGGASCIALSRRLEHRLEHRLGGCAIEFRIVAIG
ncbi:MAG: hypothetical protein ABIR58_08495 [Gemmatimonadaceae bacterium]